jgi:hypothetical protein
MRLNNIVTGTLALVSVFLAVPIPTGAQGDADLLRIQRQSRRSIQVRGYFVIGADGVVYNAHAVSGEGLSNDPDLRKAAEQAVNDIVFAQ